MPGTHVWYVSYGSNMAAARLACYLEGGCPPGGTRANPGAHDPTPPARSVPVDLPGTLYFHGDSPQWGGGVAFYDHDTPGWTAARAYLLTAAQLADVAAQEMYRAPCPDDPLVGLLGRPLPDGRHAMGPGRYETLVEVGRLDGLPLLTLTAPYGAGHVEHHRPSAAYLRMLGDGLRESRGWSAAEVAAYLRARVVEATP
ncbi:MAG: histone deacetylase [Oryzihumus sp.]